jgi:hypothetical protein
MLGHDVYYIEDTNGVNCFYDPAYEWGDPAPVINYLERTMDFFGLNGRWAYRDGASGKCFGLSQNKIEEICSTADVLISVSNSIYLRDEYRKIPVRVLIDTDPMFTQTPSKDKQASFNDVTRSLSDYTHHFSFGENIMAADSKVPAHGINWLPTRQPVCLQYWKNKGRDKFENVPAVFTTIMNLASKNKIVFDNEEWGQKDIELEKIIELPHLIPSVNFEMVASGEAKGDPEHGWLKDSGWILSGKLSQINNDINIYKDYIKNSYGEFSVAKETYVKAHTGWFSDRSACYLAAGRPVILQETGWSHHLPAGKGLLNFTTLQSAADSVREIISDHEGHSRAAAEIAGEYFESNKVLTSLLDKLG